MTDTAESERKAVVAWLRTAEVHKIGVDFTSADYLANAIERGQHRGDGHENQLWANMGRKTRS